MTVRADGTSLPGLRRSAVFLAVTLAVAVFGCRVDRSDPGEHHKAGELPASELALARDVEALTQEEFGGRGSGTPGGRLASAYLERRLEDVGLTPLGDSGYQQTFAVAQGETQLDAANLIGLVPNRRLDEPPHPIASCAHPLVVLTAHYDHLGTRDGEVYNGADDNASGVAAAIWIAQQEVGEGRSFHLVLALLDAEELGLRGARFLVDQWSDDVLARILVNLNLDMIGRSDGGTLWVAGASHTPGLVAVVEALEGFGERAGIIVRGGRDSTTDPPDWTNSSDHAAFHRAGVPFLYFGVDDHVDYHRPTDDKEKLDLGFLASAAEVVILALEEIDERSAAILGPP